MYIHIFGFKGFISCKNNFLFTHNHILKIQNAYPLFYLLQNNFPIRHLVHGDKTVFHKKTKAWDILFNYPGSNFREACYAGINL